MTRVLHIVKTSNGARWAALQAAELVRRGLDVHVALPDLQGRTVQEWERAGVTIHVAELDVPVRSIWELPEVHRRTRRLVEEVKPDLIHTHHVGVTVALRGALRNTTPIPRVFQVAGPLHLEHSLPRLLEISSAGANDYWICTSRCIFKLYEKAGISTERLFLSYAGTDVDTYSTGRTGVLRRLLGIDENDIVVGNINFIYAPKRYLGQRIGLKCHEDVIDAIAEARKAEPRIVGVLAGGSWGNSQRYERRLRARAEMLGKGRIIMPGFLPIESVRQAWPDFDCAVHVPLTENCGGCLEPLLCAVPTIGGRIGGLPELVIDGVTGTTVAIRQPGELAQAILEVVSNLAHYRALANNGRQLVRTMFDVERTAAEVHQVYEHILGRAPRPVSFSSQEAIASLSVS